MSEISCFGRGVRVCVVLLTLGCVIVGAADLGAVNRYYFSWVPDTLVAYPGDSLRLELMLESNDTIKHYGFRCLVSSELLFDSVAVDWHGSEEETTAAETGNITCFGFAWIPGEFGGFAYTLRCDPGAPPGTHVAAYLHSWVSEDAQSGDYSIVFPYNHDFFTCDGRLIDAPGLRGVVRVPESPPGDVGPISIRGLPRYAFEGTAYVPEVTVKNFGEAAADSIRVLCTIDTSGIGTYADTALIQHLGGLASRSIAFSEWIVPAAYVDYDVTLVTIHAEDPNGANDTLACQVLGVIPGDVGAVLISSPPDSVYVDSVYYPRATVTNHSPDSAVAFSVTCELRFQDIIWWVDTKQVPGLGGNDSASITFDWWMVQFEEEYEVVVYTSYRADGNAANDTVTIVVHGVFPPGDICPLSIMNPPDTVYADSAYRPSAQIGNRARDHTGVFFVHCGVDSGGIEVWADIVEDSGLGGSDTITVNFSDWSVPATGRYNVTVFTVYPYDTIPGNDTILTTISAVDPVGLEEDILESQTPSSYALFRSAPNPMRIETTISYQIPKTSLVTLSIYDTMGRRVRVLLQEVKDRGHYSTQWDGRTENGHDAPSGMYFYRLSAEGFTSTKKVIVLR